MEAKERAPIGTIDLQLERTLEHDPYEALDGLRGQPPFWCEDHGGFWVVTQLEHCREVLEDAITFVSRDAFTPPLVLSAPMLPTFADPPQLQQLRGVVMARLSPGAVTDLEHTMREVLRDIIGTLRPTGGCELMRELAHTYPIRVFGKLFGLDTDGNEDFRRQAETMLHDVSGRAAAWSSILELVSDELEARRTTPQDDLLTAIASAALDPNDAISLASTVLIGGLDTLPSSIGWAFRYLAEEPAERRRIIDDPTIIPGAVEELLRMWTVTAKEHRRATRDVDFHEVTFRAGDRVLAFVGLANRDAAAFEDPLVVDFERKPNAHMAFAVGPHRCLGRHLARHEMRVLLEEWHAAIPDYQIAPGTSLRFNGGGVWSIETLPLEWQSNTS